MTQKNKARNWFITTNNYTEDDKVKHEDQVDKSIYGLWWSEIGKECKTPHYHLYIEYENARSFTSMKKKFPRSNIQVAKGKPGDMINYADKGGTLIEEWGKPKAQGKRNDIKEIKEIIEQGGNMSDAIEVASNYQAIKTAELLLKYKEAPRKLEKIEVIWLWGEPGTGKTKWAYEKYPDIFRPLSYKWWEGYDGHKSVLIDDLRPAWCKYEELLKVLDLYPFRVETKGGSRQVKYDTIVVTCPFPPEEFYHNDENEKQLTRRITKVVHLENDPDVGGNTSPDM